MLMGMSFSKMREKMIDQENKKIQSLKAKSFGVDVSKVIKSMPFTNSLEKIKIYN